MLKEKLIKFYKYINNYPLVKKTITPISLSIATIIFYLPSLSYCFLYDDFPAITENIAIIKGHYLYSSFFRLRQWITLILRSVIYKNWQNNPLPYRLLNLSIHIINGLLLFFILIKLLSNYSKSKFLKKYAYLISLITSILFLLHPTQTQTVTYITQMTLEGTVVLFTFSIILLFIYAVSTQKIYIKILFYMLAFILTSFAVGTKIIIVVLPALIFLIDWFFLAQGNYKKILKRIPIHILFSFILFTTFAHINCRPTEFLPTPSTQVTNNRGNIITSSAEEKITPVPFFISQFKIILHYITIFIWPFHLSFDYGYKLSNSFWNADVIFPFMILLIILTTALILFMKNKSNIFTFGLCWFFVSILPRASIIPRTELVCDYKTYLPSFGILLLISISITYLLKKLTNLINNFTYIEKRKFQTISIVLFILILGVSTTTRNTVWSNEISFWQDTITKAYPKAGLYNNLGVALAYAGNKKEAIKNYKKACKLDPTYAEPVINLAFHYQQIGDINTALKYYQKALTLKEVHPQMYNNLGIIYLNNQDYQQAEYYFKLAIKYRAYYSKAHFNLGFLYKQQNKLNETLKHYKLAIQGDYSDINYFYEYGHLNYLLNKTDEAIQSLEEVKKISTNFKNTTFLLANCYYNKNNYPKAIENYNLFYNQNPTSKACAYNYAQALLNIKNYKKALPLFKKCQSELDKYPYAKMHISKCLISLGKKEEAIKELNNNVIKTIPYQNVRNDYIQFLKEIT